MRGSKAVNKTLLNNDLGINRSAQIPLLLRLAWRHNRTPPTRGKPWQRGSPALWRHCSGRSRKGRTRVPDLPSVARIRKSIQRPSTCRSIRRCFGRWASSWTTRRSTSLSCSTSFLSAKFFASKFDSMKKKDHPDLRTDRIEDQTYPWSRRRRFEDELRPCEHFCLKWIDQRIVVCDVISVTRCWS